MDSWKDYSTAELEDVKFHHFKVNHRYNFVEPETRVYTQTVEGMERGALLNEKKPWNSSTLPRILPQRIHVEVANPSSESYGSVIEYYKSLLPT